MPFKILYHTLNQSFFFIFKDSFSEHRFLFDPFANNIDPFETTNKNSDSFVEYNHDDAFFLPAGLSNSKNISEKHPSELSNGVSTSPTDKQLIHEDQKRDEDKTELFLTNLNAHIANKTTLLNAAHSSSNPGFDLNSSFYMKSNRNLLSLEGESCKYFLLIFFCFV